MSSKRESLIHDYVRGADTFSHTARMFFYSILSALLISFCLAAIVGFWQYQRQNSPEVRAWDWVILKAEFFNKVILMPGELVEVPNVKNPSHHLKFTAGHMMSQTKIKDYERDFLTRLKLVSGLAGEAGGITFLIIVLIAVARGVKLRRDEFVRGGSLFEAPKLARELKRRKVVGDLKIGEIPLPKNAEVQHLLITGAPGVGKSVLISSLLDRVKKRGERAIIYDRSGDFVRAFYNPARGDVILNPMDSRCPSWTPWGEVGSITDYDRIASAIIPKSQEADPFWVIAARGLLSATLLKMDRDGNHSVLELLRLTLSADLKELAALVEDTDAASIIGSEENAKTALSVRATMTAYLRSLRLLPHRPGDEGDEEFSVRNWVKDEKQTGWLFLTSRADQHEALKPLLTTWLDSASASILSLSPSRQRRIWMVLDELPSLQKIPSIQTALAEGRKYGLAGVIGIQSVAQLREIYGKDGAEALLGLPSTQCHFRATDPDTAEWTSKALLERDIEEAKEDMTYSASESRDGVRLAENRQVRRLVLPTEIMSLPDLFAYIRLSGDFPIAKTKMQIVDRAEIATGFEKADESKSVGNLMLEMPADPPAAPAESKEKPEKNPEIKSLDELGDFL